MFFCQYRSLNPENIIKNNWKKILAIRSPEKKAKLIKQSHHHHRNSHKLWRVNISASCVNKSWYAVKNLEAIYQTCKASVQEIISRNKSNFASVHPGCDPVLKCFEYVTAFLEISHVIHSEKMTVSFSVKESVKWIYSWYICRKVRF